MITWSMEASSVIMLDRYKYGQIGVDSGSFVTADPVTGSDSVEGHQHMGMCAERKFRLLIEA